MSPVFHPFPPDLIYFGTLYPRLFMHYSIVEKHRYEELVSDQLRQLSNKHGVTAEQFKECGAEIVPYLEDLEGKYNGNDRWGHPIRPYRKYAVDNIVPTFVLRVDSPFEDDYYSHYIVGHSQIYGPGFHIISSGVLYNVNVPAMAKEHYRFEEQYRGSRGSKLDWG